jgi:exodeoxyribonuclease V alpha subunit
MTFSETQLEALRGAMAHKFMVITGGPGTGKTTIVNAILKIFGRRSARVLLAAPTGRAAKRLSEATGHEAKTLHRLLEYSAQKGGFQRHEEKPLDGDLLVVDESSMIDTVLMHHLLKAVPLAAGCILVGDVNQLPSVGPGNIPGDIIDLGGAGRAPDRDFPAGTPESDHR